MCIYSYILLFLLLILITTTHRQSTKGHSLFEAEDKAAEEIVLGARKHLFLSNNLYSVLNHVRNMIEKVDGEGGANQKVRVVTVVVNVVRDIVCFLGGISMFSLKRCVVDGNLYICGRP